MTQHPGLRMIAFTCSIDTGKKVAQPTASNLTWVVLELGGNEAAIVLPDVDPKQVASQLKIVSVVK